MMRIRRSQLRRPMIVASAALAVVAAGGTTVAAAAPAEPPLRLVTAASSVTLDRWVGEPGEPGVVNLDLGAHMVAGRTPFELRVTRKSYGDPVVATQVIRRGGTTRTKGLPRGLVKDFSGLPDFLHVVVTNAAGKKVVDRYQKFCPNSESGRTRPGAPDSSPYPDGCPTNPFTLGSVWGIQAGWGANTVGWDSSEPVDLPDGKYTAKISVKKVYRDLFGIPATPATLKVTVRTRAEPGPGHLTRLLAADAPDARSSTTVLRPNATRPTGQARVPRGPKPDLRALPAWGIAITDGDGEPAAANRDYLAFSANVWNAGPSPLVVDGFRRAGQDLMDAYQYFYDAKGKQVGHARTGTMEFDLRDGHEHWHFTDFASYRLLNASKKQVVRSQKEAFCLANTDAIDYTVKNAKWKPSNTDLHTSCGRQSSLSVREVLDVGSGDTYAQFLPGQSFDITNLRNGTYYIQVIANPDHRLYESNPRNNVSLRKVILGGRPGARTVKVPPHQLIDAP